MTRQDIAERFKRDTANHEMTILHDDGLYRHLQFTNPDCRWAYWFQLITVPNALIFRGDGESFIFSRLQDMFEFFRGPIGHINPSYWAEKLTSDRDSVKKYDQNLFEQRVKENVAEAIRDRTAPRGISRAIKEFLQDEDITWEPGARRALADFEYRLYTTSCSCGATETFSDDLDASSWCRRHPREAGDLMRHHTSMKPGEAFTFEDTWEWDFQDYHWWFLWALHGIVWGIAQYDAAKTASENVYLVWSNEHRCWWGPNRSGYAQDVWEAGRYDRESAAAICRTRSWPQDAPPPEVMVLAPEAGRGAFTVDDFRALPEMMRQRVEEATGKAITARDAEQSVAVTS